MNTNSNIELIEKYLEGKLTPAEINELENAAQNNPELKQEIELQKNLVKRIRHTALQVSVKNAHVRFEKRTALVKKIWIISSVAVVAALLGLAWFMTRTEKEHAKIKTSVNVQQENLVSAGQTEKGVVIPVEPEKEKPLKDSIVTVAKKPADIIKFSTYEFSAEKGIEVKDKRSGTSIIIPGGALTDKNGKAVTGKVILKYREFRQQSDFALAGYPMTYKDMNFNSAGMFEIWALQKNDTLGIKNGAAAEMKFKMTKNEKGIGFYKLDIKKKTWEKISEEESGIESKRYSFTREPDMNREFERINKEAEERLKKEAKQYAKDLLKKKAFPKDEKLNQTEVNPASEGKVYEDIFETDNNNENTDTASKTKKVFWGKRSATEGQNFQRQQLVNQNNYGGKEEGNSGDQMVDPGHYADPLIWNLRLSGFGVFNCDQVYRIKNPVNIRATYIDEKKEQIRNLKVVNVIDKKINGAFSFNPYNFTCCPEGTMLVLFTNDNRIYFLNEEMFYKVTLRKSGKYVFPMKEITNEVQCSEDLQELLRLNGTYENVAVRDSFYTKMKY